MWKGDKSLQQNRSDVADYILHTDNEQMSIVHDEKARTKLQINELTLKLDREFAVTSEQSKNLELPAGTQKHIESAFFDQFDIRSCMKGKTMERW